VVVDGAGTVVTGPPVVLVGFTVVVLLGATVVDVVVVGFTVVVVLGATVVEVVVGATVVRRALRRPDSFGGGLVPRR
jgi:hypothetical protein